MATSSKPAFTSYYQIPRADRLMQATHEKKPVTATSNLIATKTYQKYGMEDKSSSSNPGSSHRSSRLPVQDMKIEELPRRSITKYLRNYDIVKDHMIWETKDDFTFHEIQRDDSDLRVGPNDNAFVDIPCIDTSIEEATPHLSSMSVPFVKDRDLPQTFDSRYAPVMNRSDQYVRVCCVSDTHGIHESIAGIPVCDIFIHAGDIFFKSQRKTFDEIITGLRAFNDWIAKIPATHKLVIAGNHDYALQKLGKHKVQSYLSNCEYLCNDLVVKCGLKIFGTPYSNGVSGNSAFQGVAFFDQLQNELEVIDTSDIDILISHGPSHSLTNTIKPKLLHVWGHLHWYRGVYTDCALRRSRKDEGRYPESEREYFDERDGDVSLFRRYDADLAHHDRVEWTTVSCSLLNESYRMQYFPITVDIPM